MHNTKHERGIFTAIAGARSAEPVVEIKSYALAGSGIARVVLDVTHTSESRANPALVATVLRKKLNNQMEAIAGSFFSLDKGAFTERLTGVVGAVRQIVSASDESAMKGFKAFASNMFMDDESHMWVMRQTQAGKILVKSTGVEDDESLAAMLQSCSSVAAVSNMSEHGRMLAQASAVAQQAEGGHYVSFVNADNAITQGFVVASVADSDNLIVLSHGAEAPEQISRLAVTQIHDTNDFPEVEESAEQQVETVVAAARNGIDLEYLLNFYKRVYARSPQFFAQFAERLRKHAFC